MLIINIILFISAICSATNVATTTGTTATNVATLTSTNATNVTTSTGTTATSVTSTKFKRGIIDPGHDIRNNQQTRGTQPTPRASTQNINSRSLPHYRNSKGSDSQKVSYVNQNHGSGSHAYGSVPKQPFSYVSSPTQQSETHRVNPLTPYLDILNDPSIYKAATNPEKPLETPKSIVSPSLQKLQGTYSPNYNTFHQDKSIESSGLSDLEYPSYASISKLISQSIQNSAPSSVVQVPVYKTSYPFPKVTDYAHVYAPSFPILSSITPSSDKTTQSSKQKDEVTVDMHGKKFPVPVIQLQSNPDLSGIFSAFENQAFLLSTNYPTETDFGFNLGTGPKFNLALQSKNISPFLSPLSSFQGQIVPIQTANGSPQFPQYKGASIEVYPVSSNAPKAQGNYQSLYNQPQLHFGKEHGANVQSANENQNIVHHSVLTEDILNDAEIINKKNPEPHVPQPDDDDREDERYKIANKESESSSEDEDVEYLPGKYFKEPPTESDFKPSTSYPFREYDELFGNYRGQTDDDDSENKPHKNYSSSEVEEEENPSSDYHTESSKPPRDSYEEEDEDEEESRKHERREKQSDEGSGEVKPKRSKYYEKDFEQEFEESYRKELPKQEYVHIKEVPEIDSNNNPKLSKRQQKNNNRSHASHEQTEESTGQEFRVSHKNRKTPKRGYRDNIAYGSNISAKTEPKVVYEEFFTYKNPETGKYSKHAKTEIAANGKYSFSKKLPKEDSYLRAAKYYKLKNPKTGSRSDSKNKNSYPYSLTNNWKSGKNSPEETVLRTNVRQLSDPGDKISFYGPSVVKGQMRSLTNAEILRDLTGI